MCAAFDDALQRERTVPGYSHGRFQLLGVAEGWGEEARESARPTPDCVATAGNFMKTRHGKRTQVPPWSSDPKLLHAQLGGTISGINQTYRLDRFRH